MRRSQVSFAASLVAFLTLAACGDAARPTPRAPVYATVGGGATGGTEMDLGACTRCHGDPANGNAAPPLSTRGLTATADLSVGAHQKHLAGATVRAPIACDECHVVPLAVGDAGHIGSGPAAVVFGAPRSPGLGTTAGAAPQWNRADATCSNVYCHGGTLKAGGTNTAPRWTGGPAQAACGTCHAIPSSNPAHPAVSTELTGCNLCHPQSVDATGALIAGGKHLDGNVDFAGGHPAGWASPTQHGASANRGGLADCQACHGQDLKGGTTGVSCDSCHAGGTAWRTNCTFCHGDATRSAVALLKAAPPQSAAGETATTVRAVGAHQKHLADGPLAKAIGCTECHTVPSSVLDAGHVNGTRDVKFGTLAQAAGATATWDGANGGAPTCATYCHGATLAGGSLKAPDWTKVDAAQAACGTCHGVPPPTASGAHAKVTATTQCATCHPGTIDAAGALKVAGGLHVNGAVDRVAYHPAGWAPSTGGIAHANAANTTGTAACVACHGDAQGSGGYVNVACVSCHKAGGTANDFGTAAAPGCTACHGGTLTGTDGAGLARAPAPPKATLGSTRPPGAHARHLTVDAAFAPATTFACAQCHTVPTAPLHASGAVDLAWGSVAAPAGQVGADAKPLAPTFDAAANTCASTWCHGNFRNGNAKTMSWSGTAADAACGTCHGLPPAGTHPTLATGTACSGCHQGYGGTVGGAAAAFTVNAATHLDGVIQVSGSHPGGWADPSQHGLQAVNVTATPGGIQSCTACHVGFGPANGSAATSCDACHQSAGHASWRTECTFCHGGNDNQTGAPARDTHAVRGTVQATATVTVGAHTSHVAATHALDAPLACADCHVTPADATDPGHIDAATATVTFGATAKLGGAAPAWTRASASCASTYCHGATLNATTTRGSATAPVWTTVNGSQATCGSCHQAPPGTANHHNAAALTTCAKCHAATATAAGGIVAGGGKHIDGNVDATVTGCTTCHGNPAVTPAGAQDANLAAAPTGAGAPDTFGNTATTSAGVGAHAVHVLGARSKAVACNACHTVPSTPVHKTGVVTAATLTFGNLAATGGAASVYNADKTCSSSYCHGGFTGGAGTANRTPAWTVAGTLGCTSCHGAPPPASTGHVQRTDCGACHTGYTSTTVNVATHVNGTVDVVALNCTTCHGDATRAGVAGADANVKAAPPIDAKGNTVTTAAGVGVHQSHVNGSRSRPVGCAECHSGAVPTTTTGHTKGTTTVAFGTLAKTGAVAPAYTAGSCAATYCHGNFAGGNGAAATPAWTAAGTLGCTACHGAPPPASTGHVQRTDCGACHTGYTSTTVNAATHVNGAVDVIPLGCTTCHGDATRVAVASADANVAAAPPVDAKGNTVTTAAGVGVHQTHVNGSRSKPVACAECHAGAVPTTTTGHTKGTTTVAFGTLAKTGAVAPAYTSGSCAATYCHGNFTGGNGTATTPAWTAAGTLGCTSCHGSPPALPHPQDTACADCHGVGYSSTTVVAATHVDGQVTLVASHTGCTSCHGDAARTGIAGADANLKAAPPIGTKGETALTARAVGAHQAHLNTATLRTNPIACSECHAVPAAGDKTHANGAAALTFGALAKTGGLAPAWNTTALTCASTYCHGGSLQGGTKTAPVWTTVDGTQKTCTSCHGAPPPASSGHVQRTDCGSCHAGYTLTAVNPATHINGTVDVVALACTTCHGNASLVAVANADANVKAAPPVDTQNNSVTTARGVGVHQTHVNGSRSKPVACAECHSGAVPTTTTGHTKGTVTVAFGALAKTGTVTPAWNTTALTCASTYCHGNFTGGNGTAATPAWTSAGTLACTACHGAPPALPHPQNTSCGTCHSGYTATTVNALTHVNGVVDQTGAGCTQCHGTPGRTTYAAEAPPIDTKGNTATTSRGVGAHATHLTAGGLSNPIACTECHVVPAAGDKTHANGTAAITFGALAKTGAVTPAWNGAAAGGATTCSNVYCHGNFTNGTKTNAPNWTGTGQAACGTCHAIPPAGSHPTLTAGTNCSGCHTGYSATPGSTNGTVNLANHVNGKVDVTGGGESAGGTNCGGCHGTIFNAMLATGGKVTRHTITTDVPNDTGGTWSGNLKSAAPYAAASCVSMCHGDHPHAITTGGTHENNVYLDANARSTTSSATTRAKTDFDNAQTNGGLCISCHLNPVDANHPAISKAGYQASAHNFTANTVGTATNTWQYTLHDNGAFARNCTKCHASPAEGTTPTVAATGSGTVGPHASDFGSLLAGTTNPAGTPASFVCYNCHGNGGTVGKNLSGKDIATEAAKAQGHGPAIDADAKHVTATEEATTYNSGLLSGTNRHASCLDCHDTHMAGKVRHTPGPNDGAIGATSPLNGVSGVGYTGTLPANFAAIPSTNLAKVATAAFEYQVCFKCHTGWAFGTTPPTGPSTLAETDLAQEFNVNNKSAHPVVNALNNQTGSTAKGLVASQLLAPWNTSPGAQTMTCTDCHNTDAASTAAQGPHGSAVTFMLTGANKAWPYTVAGANTGTLFRVATSETGLGTTNGLFCRNCHPQMNSTGSNSLHRNSNITGGQHGNGTPAACVACHIRIPHGGKVSRLLVTTPAPTRYKVGTSNFAQITKGATKDSYSTSGFPTGFKSSCGQHSSGTGNETW